VVVTQKAWHCVCQAFYNSPVMGRLRFLSESSENWAADRCAGGDALVRAAALEIKTCKIKTCKIKTFEFKT
jgi:hypothetical protein